MVEDFLAQRHCQEHYLAEFIDDNGFMNVDYWKFSKHRKSSRNLALFLIIISLISSRLRTVI